MIRWGILGAGRIAARVGADIAASAGSEVAAVGARALDRARTLADELGAPRAYGSYRELVSDPDIDVIYVATTHAQHHEHALLALRAGRHVMVEKAFTLTERQAQEVVDEARNRNRFCMEAMWMRMNPLVRRAVDLVRDGQLGDIVAVHADHGQYFPFDPANRLFDMAAGGGALLDLGVYSAAFGWLFLGKPDTVRSTGSLAPTGADLTAAMQWGYADGRFAQLSCTSGAATPCVATVMGSQGWLSLGTPFYRPTALVVQRRGEEPEISTEPLPGNGFGPEVAEVERCLAAGLIESELSPWADTIGIMRVLDGVRAELGVHYPADDVGDIA
jgi:predicted dehydrogenase